MRELGDLGALRALRVLGVLRKIQSPATSFNFVSSNNQKIKNEET